MIMQARKIPYRIVYAYDSETCNIIERDENGISKGKRAFPILHQIGKLDTSIDNISSENVEDHTEIKLFRHTLDLYSYLDAIIENETDYVPVMVCHNLSFDMYALAPWLNSHDVKVLAKSRQKPITFTVTVNGKPKLVIWDTLIFSQKPLATMGRECGYQKAVGEWDYNLIRTPETPLSRNEIDYAVKDIYALFAWLASWVHKNPDISSDKLGLNVVTKTGVVRQRRKQRFYNIKSKPNIRSIGEFQHLLSQWEAPKSDDELFTMQAATRGGFTFCSSANASIPYDLPESKCAIGYDATSQHPAQMVSHLYPVKFHETSSESLDMACKLIDRVTLDKLLTRWYKPFHAAFYGCFEVTNLRPKANSLYRKWGILPLASARLKRPIYDVEMDNEQNYLASERRFDSGYHDFAENPKCEFGKLVSVDRACLYLTELGYYELKTCYDFDDIHAISGYMTGRFVKPTDMSIISVMQFYDAKNEFKRAREQYYGNGKIDNGEKLVSLGVPNYIVHDMEHGCASENDIELQYLSLKADLNALFGVEACNEYRRDTVLTSSGIAYVGDNGLSCKPKNLKAWYQFGQRIVGWSRIAQLAILQLAEPYIDTCVNGDTDSLKFIIDRKRIPALESAIQRYSSAVDNAKTIVCKRVKERYPAKYNELEYIGHYVKEFESQRYCASWNKAYCVEENGRYAFTIAGIPKRGNVDKLASWMHEQGKSFADICNIMLGYNVTYAYSMIRYNQRAFPEWGEIQGQYVTDYLGNSSYVAEPSMICLYPASKTVNDTLVKENAVNEEIALSNNANVNTEACIIVKTDTGFAIRKAIG